MSLELLEFLKSPLAVAGLPDASRDKYFAALRTGIKDLRAEPPKAAAFVSECIKHSDEFLLEAAAFANAALAGKPEAIRNCELIASVASSPFVLGVVNFARREYDMAASNFDAFTRSADKAALKFHQTGAMGVRSSDFEPPQMPLPSIDLVRKANSGSGAVMLVSCDTGYLVAYGPEFLSAVEASGARVHFHVINPIENLVTNVLSGYERHGLSFEKVGFGDLKTYSAISRYVILEHMLEIYDEIAVCDIDVDVRASNLIAGLDAVGPGKIGLYLSAPHGAYFAWTAVMAGFAVFRNELRTKRLLLALRCYLLSHYADGRDGWMLDQTALEWWVRATAHADVVDMRLGPSPLKLTQVGNRAAKRRIARDAIAARN